MIRLVVFLIDSNDYFIIYIFPVTEKFDKKTKTFKNSLDKLKIDSLLIVIGSEEDKENLLNIINNIPNIDLIKQIGLNVYDLMKKEKVLITVKAIKELEERLG